MYSLFIFILLFILSIYAKIFLKADSSARLVVAFYSFVSV